MVRHKYVANYDIIMSFLLSYYDNVTDVLQCDLSDLEEMSQSFSTHRLLYVDLVSCEPIYGEPRLYILRDMKDDAIN